MTDLLHVASAVSACRASRCAADQAARARLRTCRCDNRSATSTRSRTAACSNDCQCLVSLASLRAVKFAAMQGSPSIGSRCCPRSTCQVLDCHCQDRAAHQLQAALCPDPQHGRLQALPQVGLQAAQPLPIHAPLAPRAQQRAKLAPYAALPQPIGRAFPLSSADHGVSPALPGQAKHKLLQTTSGACKTQGAHIATEIAAQAARFISCAASDMQSQVLRRLQHSCNAHTPQAYDALDLRCGPPPCAAIVTGTSASRCAAPGLARSWRRGQVACFAALHRAICRPFRSLIP